MYIIRGIGNLPDRFRGGAVTIGNFDGVHLGHQAIFARLRRLAAHHPGAPTLAVTFEPHPLRLLDPSKAPVRITGVRGKSRWMERHGVDAMFILQFNRTLAAMEAERFVRTILADGLDAREVLVGDNFRFGAGGKGHVPLLEELGIGFGFGVHKQSLHQVDGQPVSSTRIRQAVGEGDFATAERLLGRSFEIEGRVGRGQQRGKGLGFPTANLTLSGLLHPPPGVYVVEGRVDGGWLPGVANLGRNPTFGDVGLGLETHLLAPCGNLYRKVLRVRFRKRLRGEVRFSGPQALVEQISKDVAQAQAFFAI
ncbi:MAG: riboflavin biosynthesis protein RibF [Magnetococcales bacterium]|nr:riboflavin biosynthesis protein RibF [Magnetococcales bacterium]